MGGAGSSDGRTGGSSLQAPWSLSVQFRGVEGLGRGAGGALGVELISKELRDGEHGLFAGSWEELSCSSFGASDKSDVYKS